MLKILKTIYVEGRKTPLSLGHNFDENSALGLSVISQYGSSVAKHPKDLKESSVACIYDEKLYPADDIEYVRDDADRVLKVVEVAYNMATLESRQGNSHAPKKKKVFDAEERKAQAEAEAKAAAAALEAAKLEPSAEVEAPEVEALTVSEPVADDKSSKKGRGSK